MRIRNLSVALIALTLSVGSCSDNGMVGPTGGPVPIGPSLDVAATATLPEVRISEIHYDNAGTDVGERVEVSGPANRDLTGWTVVPYNGANGLQYNPVVTLSGALSATCGTRGVIVADIAGLQNGAPDGVALIDKDGSVVEFLSYEGTFTAANGPAAGMLSKNIGASEAGTEPLGLSLQRDGANLWSEPKAHTFGACNDNDVTPPAEVASITVAPVSATIVVAATQQFTATAFDAAGQLISGATLSWSSSSESIATITSTGVVTGASPGDVKIRATALNGVFGEADLHVDEAPPPPPDPPRIVEIHYDNAGADTGEAIEIDGPAGMSLSGWSVVLYNGSNGTSYNTIQLSGTIPPTCGVRGVVVLNYPSNGIQNGSPDGVALVGPNGVVEFLSYEGSFGATNGPASGRTSTDISANEHPDNSVPTGWSIQRDASDTWYGPEPASFGTCNTRPVESTATVVINELMADPLRAAGGASWGEWFEVHNYGANPVDMERWTIVSNGQPDHMIASSVTVPAGGFAVLGRGADLALNGGVTLNYNYFTGSATPIFLDETDRLELRDAAGARVDVVRWSSTTSGVTRALRNPALDNVDVGGSNWGYSTVAFGDGDLGTPGAANGTLSATLPSQPNFLTFSGRTPGDVPLPVGFQDQFFATLRNGSGDAIPSTFTWSTLTPTVASIDQNGIITALEAGTAIVRATAADGTTRTYSLPTRVATAGPAAQYTDNTEFGTPNDGNAIDDYLVVYPQYTASYNRNRGIPNWVSYNIDATHFGAEDRCDCFTFDPTLPTAFTRYTTADYTGASTFHGYGIDRGHLARSFDRTAGSLDNARTFYFTNIIPQAADNNQGPWANMESYLGDRAREQNKEVYIVAGVAGSKGTVKNEGRITIPAFVWKVAVIMPRDQGRRQVNDYTDVEVIAAIMPNEPGTRNVAWETYKTTVDGVEELSGYDLLALLSDQIEIAVESNTKPPTALTDGPYTSAEGSPITMSAAGSTDPDGDALIYRWDLGDGTTRHGVTISHTYAQDGTYDVRLTVTDPRGLTDAVTTRTTVANVAPVIAPLTGATLLPHETYAANGSFTDPGADSWTATVDYGDGSRERPLTLVGKSFSLTHTYTMTGNFRVTVSISDDDATTTREQSVTVLTPAQGATAVIGAVDRLAAGGMLAAGVANALTSTLRAAVKQLEANKITPAINQLNAFLNQVDALIRSNRLSETNAAPLRTGAQRVIRSVSP